MKTSKFLFLLFFLTNGHSYAQEEDTHLPIHISSDKQHVYLKENRVVFSGHVKVTQGSIHIEAKTLTMIKEGDSKKKTLIALGEPATYSQIIDDHPAIASANKITYILEDKMVYLNGTAHIKQQDSVVKGELITYNALDKEIIAQGNSDNHGRVLTIFQPEEGL